MPVALTTSHEVLPCAPRVPQQLRALFFVQISRSMTARRKMIARQHQDLKDTKTDFGASSVPLHTKQPCWSSADGSHKYYDVPIDFQSPTPHTVTKALKEHEQQRSQLFNILNGQTSTGRPQSIRPQNSQSHLAQGSLTLSHKRFLSHTHDDLK